MNDSGTSKKTLMGAIEQLNRTVDQFNLLAETSETLITKFKRTENMPKALKSASINDPKCIPQCDIIDLFNNINDRLNLSLNTIGGNVEGVINMIE